MPRQHRRSWSGPIPFVVALSVVVVVALLLASAGEAPSAPGGATRDSALALAPTAANLPYTAYTLNVVNGSLLPQNQPGPGCSLPTPAPYIVHFPEGPTAAMTIPALNEVVVVCPTGDLLVVNATTGGLVSVIPVGVGPDAIAPSTAPGSGLYYVVNEVSSSVSVVSWVTNEVVGVLGLPALTMPDGLALGPGGSTLYVTEAAAGVVSVLSLPSGALVQTIPVGEAPAGAAFDPLNGLLYVANHGAATVSVISPRNDSVVATIPAGFNPVDVAVSLSNGNVYVSNEASANVTVIDDQNNTVLTSVPVGAGPLGVAYSPSDDAVYVADNGSDAVSIINTTTNAVGSPVPVGTTPVAVAPGPGAVYSVNSAAYNLSEIRTSSHTVVNTLEIAASPRGMAYDPTNGQLYIPLGGNDSVAVVNTATNHLVTLIRTGLEPSLAAYDPLNGMVYVDNHMSDTVSVIDPASNTVTTTIPVGEGPTSMALDPSTGNLYIGGGHIYVVEVLNTTTNTITNTIPVGNTPYGLIYAPVDGGRVYVTNYRSNNLSIIDPATESVIGNYPVGTGPTLMAYDSANQLLYISSFGTNQIIPLNTSTDIFASPIGVGMQPMGILSGGPGGLLYVTNYGSGNLTAISPATGRTVGSTLVGSEPIASALLPNGQTYVTDAGASSVSILSNNTFLGLAINASATSVSPDGSVTLTAVPTCVAATCPSSVAYSWAPASVPGGGWFLNATTGPVVTLYVGNSSGTINISVLASLGLAVFSSHVLVTVSGSSSSSGSSGLQGVALYALIAGVVIAVAAVVASLWYVRAHRAGPPPPAAPSPP